MTLKSDVFTAQDPQVNQVQNTLDAAKIQGRIRSLYAEWTADGTEGAAAVIDMGKVPLGAYIIDAEAIVRVAGPVGSASLGDVDDSERYITGIDQTAAGTFAGTRQAGGAGYKVATEAQRALKLTTAGTFTAGQKIDVIVRWAQT